MVKKIRAIAVPKADIISMRKSSEGKMEIRLRGEEKEVQEKIKVTEGLAVASKTRMAHVIIKDLDSQVVKEEIVEALIKFSGLSANDLEAKSLRPAFGGTQRAVVRAPAPTISKLIEEGRVPIGWVKCKTAKHVLPVTCYKCGETGHRVHEYVHPDRSRLCFKCGQLDHHVKDCESSWRCFRCSERHRTGSNSCKADGQGGHGISDEHSTGRGANEPFE